MFDLKDVAAEVLLAESCIRPFIRETTLEYTPYLSKNGGVSVFCKLENLQHTAAFKVRGAINKLLSLNAEQLSHGVIAASTGNHGAAVAFSLNILKARGIVFVPRHTPQSKIDAIERLGSVEVRSYGEDCAITESYARQYALKNQLVYISPYNDPKIIAGQGTIAVELARQLDKIDAVFISLGGGGLISGIAGYLKTVHPNVQIFGCSPDNSQVMIQSIKAGEILDLPSLPTLSEGTAGGVEPGAITFELCQTLVDEYITVSENEIKESLGMFIQNQHMLIEGAAAVAVASFLKIRERFVDQNVVIVICGANINLETLRSIL